MLDHSAHQLNPGRDNSTAADRIAVDRCSVLWGAMMAATSSPIGPPFKKVADMWGSIFKTQATCILVIFTRKHTHTHPSIF